ncbi:YkgJ family cysteine cluster protein [Puniceibacterium sp. IMCC21224]|uniref:YkgJ family cysteine cluster protein n=1 Tax=Puniceibacterium sp. IMCC21224 TaxID=1618204 RepID=UPI00064E122B|nr:YkgJ family cysteine cluster protein [Puniceibacterium sp. IMCC21224]KMK68618.1 putative zinc- or iron-chelating domain [Puniceibacterium sp. IMCC21224]
MQLRRPAPRPNDLPALRARVAALRLKGPSSPQVEQARKLLLLYLDTAAAHAVPFADMARDLRSGLPALRIAGAQLEQQATDPSGPLTQAACASGCAFCCILSGTDGGTILEAEARALHDALQPLAGQPDGRDWHPRACPALDPATRNCRVYATRPLICRTYVSSDATACAEIAKGTPATGAGVLGAQGLMLAVQALARAALDGVTQVPTYSMARVAAAAIAGKAAKDTLRSARHPPRTLDDERLRLGG